MERRRSIGRRRSAHLSGSSRAAREAARCYSECRTALACRCSAKVSRKHRAGCPSCQIRLFSRRQDDQPAHLCVNISSLLKYFMPMACRSGPANFSRLSMHSPAIHQSILVQRCTGATPVLPALQENEIRTTGRKARPTGGRIGHTGLLSLQSSASRL